MSTRRIVDVDWRKLKDHKQLKYSLAGFAASLVAGVLFYVVKPVVVEFNSSFAMNEFKSHGVVGTYQKHYHHFFDKMENLATADKRETHLVRELASVQKDLEVEKAKNTETEVKEETDQIAERLKTEAGSTVARIPDGINYEIPTQILPHQLHVLGMEYFRKHDYEKSAVIFHELTHLKDDDGFQRADNYLMSAVSWYKLKHYEMAADYLKLAQKKAVPGSSMFRQTLLWEAMLEKARGHQEASQKVLTRLMSLYPLSEEAALINKSRVPASKKETLEEAHHAHE